MQEILSEGLININKLVGPEISHRQLPCPRETVQVGR